jgi:hypothetical protein
MQGAWDQQLPNPTAVVGAVPHMYDMRCWCSAVYVSLQVSTMLLLLLLQTGCL